MIACGMYTTKGGLEARVLFSGGAGASGYVVMDGEKVPVAWHSDGYSFTDDLDLELKPPIITILETKLPEPIKASAPHMCVIKVRGDDQGVVGLLLKMRFASEEAAEAWAKWWRENVMKEGKEKPTS